MGHSRWTEPRLFDPGPAVTPELQIRVGINLSGPSGTATVWVEEINLQTGHRLSFRSHYACSLEAAPAVAAEILQDAVRAGCRGLVPF